MAKRIITEKDILQAASHGDEALYVPPAECIVTAQARDKAQEFGVSLIDGCGPSEPCPTAKADPASNDKDRELSNIVRQVVQGIQSSLPPDADEGVIAGLVRNAVAARLANARSDETFAPSGVIFIDNAQLLAKTSATSFIKERTELAEAIGRSGESKLAAGYLVWEGMTFERAVGAPEILVVIEGELHLKYDGRTAVAKPGDMAYLPEGTRVSLDAPSRVKLACINTLA